MLQIINSCVLTFSTFFWYSSRWNVLQANSNYDEIHIIPLINWTLCLNQHQIYKYLISVTKQRDLVNKQMSNVIHPSIQFKNNLSSVPELQICRPWFSWIPRSWNVYMWYFFYIIRVCKFYSSYVEEYWKWYHRQKWQVKCQICQLCHRDDGICMEYPMTNKNKKVPHITEVHLK